MTSITNFVVLTRYIYKGFFTTTRYGYDDLALIMVQASGIPSTIIIEVGMIPNGFGRDIWTVSLDYIHQVSAVLVYYRSAVFRASRVSQVSITLFSPKTLQP